MESKVRKKRENGVKIKNKMSHEELNFNTKRK